MRRFLAFVAIALVIAGVAAGAAQALHLVVGEIVVDAEGGFAPQALPRREDAPITIHGGGSISTLSGALPPILKELTLLYDRHGSVETEGLERCTKAKLAATDTAQAKRACPEAIVGEGSGTAVVKFPEQEPIRASSPIILFNGPPGPGGAPTVLAHAYLSIPEPTTYIVPVVIERIRDGDFGYRTKATIPPIAGGAGIPISGHLEIGRRWTYRGHRLSYVNARCETGKLEAKGEFSFSDGTRLEGFFIKPCRVRG